MIARESILRVAPEPASSLELYNSLLFAPETSLAHGKHAIRMH